MSCGLPDARIGVAGVFNANPSYFKDDADLLGQPIITAHTDIRIPEDHLCFMLVVLVCFVIRLIICVSLLRHNQIWLARIINF